MPIPKTLLSDLDRIPRDRPVTLLMRHSNRFPIDDPADPYKAALTEEGFRLAEELGVILREHFHPGRVMSSPVERCIDTATAIARGAGWSVEVLSHALLSHDHISPAWIQAEQGGCESHIPEQVLETMNLLLEHHGKQPVLEVMVTHDTIVGAVVSCVLKAAVLGEDWPRFLEGVFFWKDGDSTHLLWRGNEQVFESGFEQEPNKNAG
jgi:hypothetical protein